MSEQPEATESTEEVQEQPEEKVEETAEVVVAPLTEEEKYQQAKKLLLNAAEIEQAKETVARYEKEQLRQSRAARIDAMRKAKHDEREKAMKIVSKIKTRFGKIIKLFVEVHELVEEIRTEANVYHRNQEYRLIQDMIEEEYEHNTPSDKFVKGLFGMLKIHSFFLRNTK